MKLTEKQKRNHRKEIKMKKKKCHYFCDGYCFWHGDMGYVCDTNNNQHDGYCPMEESDKELEAYAKAIIENETERETAKNR